MKIKKIICLALAALMAASALTGCGNDKPKIFDTTSVEFTGEELNEIETRLDETLITNDFHGGAQVKLNKNTIYDKYFGEENGLGDKITEKTVFPASSVTRVFTGAAIYKLIDQKKLSLNTPMSKFFSGGSYLSEVTIEDLLNASVRLHYYITLATENKKFMAKLDKAYEKKDDEAIKKLVTNEIISKGIDKNKTSAYSNYYILGIIIEKVSGKSYKEFIKTEFFDKLGMKDSGFIKTGGSMMGYDMNNKRWVRQNEYRSLTSYGFLFSSFGITTTVSDATKFFSAFLEGKLTETDIAKRSLNSSTSFNCGLSSDGRNLYLQSQLFFCSSYITLNYEDLETVVLFSNFVGKTDISKTGNTIARSIRSKINGIILGKK